jgi:REP element-mobilizing transposase RayT
MNKIRARKLNRLKNFDYTQDGCYFVTICSKNRIECFGDVLNEEMRLNEFGRIIRECWLDLPNHYANCELDEYIIMPNHVHGIIVINNENMAMVGTVGTGFKPGKWNKINMAGTVGTGFKHGKWNKINMVGTGLKPVPTVVGKIYSLSEIIRGFKTFSSRKINEQYPGVEFRWQRSFYDHIIRNEKSLEKIRRYIYYNPAKWEYDRNQPANLFM